MAGSVSDGEGVSLSRTFTGQGSPVQSVAYMPNMRQAISGSADGSVMVWNFKPQHRAYRLRGHKGAVMSVEVAPNEALFASGSADHTVRLWKPSVQGSFKEFRAHAGAVCSINFSQDSRLLLTGSADKMIKLWDLTALRTERPKFVWCIQGHRNWVRDAHIGVGSFRACSGSDDKQVKVWDMKTSENVATFDDHEFAVRSVRFDPLSGVCVASGDEGGQINLWDVRSEQVVQHYALKTPSSIQAVRFHPSGNYLLTTSRDSAMRFWDLREGRLLYTVCAHTKSVNAAAFSEDGGHILTGSSDALVLAWQCPGLCEPKEDPLAYGEEEKDPRESKPRKHSHSHHSKRRHSKKHHHHHHNHHHHHHRRRSSDQDAENDKQRSQGGPDEAQERTSSSRRRGSSKHHHSRKHSKSKSSRRSSKHAAKDDGVAVELAPVNTDDQPQQRDYRSKSIGEFTRQAALASMSNRINSVRSMEQPSAPPAPPPGLPATVHPVMSPLRVPPPPTMPEPSAPPAASVDTSSDNPNASADLGAIARALENLEKRLRLNEDIVADLHDSQTQR